MAACGVSGEEIVGRGAGEEEEVRTTKTTARTMAGGEERIVVSVRLRPVNAREAERGDGTDWDCSGPTTLRFLGTIPERAMFPATYTYGTHRLFLLLLPSCPTLQNAHFSIRRRPDRVFSPECNTRQVYEEGAKEVALSVLAGINCTHARYMS
jgi:centromeric protein E